MTTGVRERSTLHARLVPCPADRRRRPSNPARGRNPPPPDQGPSRRRGPASGEHGRCSAGAARPADPRPVCRCGLRRQRERTAHRSTTAPPETSRPPIMLPRPRAACRPWSRSGRQSSQFEGCGTHAGSPPGEPSAEQPAPPPPHPARHGRGPRYRRPQPRERPAALFLPARFAAGFFVVGFVVVRFVVVRFLVVGLFDSGGTTRLFTVDSYTSSGSIRRSSSLISSVTSRRFRATSRSGWPGTV